MSRDPEDRGVLLGEGLFETVLVVDGEPCHIDAHLERMWHSARTLGLVSADPFPTSPERLHAKVIAGESRIDWEDAGRPRRAVLRVTLTSGSGRGLVRPAVAEPTVEWTLSPLPDVPDRAPLAAVTVRAHRVDPGAAVSGHKVLSWMPWILARREALARGADVALVATVDGDVCEADHANLFAVVGNVVVTPGLDRGVLPGITRARALAALRRDGRPVEERALAAADLGSASEAFLTSSLDGVRALASIDGRALAAPGPVTAWLADCVGDL